jgi:mRNA interferase MazF
MRRGQIYYIHNRHTIGAEIRKARPAVIISNDHLNDTSGVITVAYLTTQPKKERPEHAPINATGVASVVLCEQIDSVDKSLVGDYCGECSDEEMAAINEAICRALCVWPEPIEAPAPAARYQEIRCALDDCLRELTEAREALGAAVAQRDRYERIIDIMSLQAAQL